MMSALMTFITNQQISVSIIDMNNKPAPVQEIPEQKSTQRETAEKFYELLKVIAPSLFTIDLLNAKFLKEMSFGEIHIVEHIKNGRIYRIEAYPKISIHIES